MDNKFHVAESLDDGVLELDADKVFLVTETFSNVDMYVESDKKQGIIKLNAPGLYNFELPEPESLNEVTTHIINDSEMMKLGSWTQEPIEEVNLIKAEDEELLGELQRDEITGEFYIMLPVEINVLLKPELNQNIQQIAESLLMEETEIDNNMEQEQEQEEEDENASQTTLTDETQEMQVHHLEKPLEICRFVVPKMNLNFRMTMTIGDVNNTEEQTNEDLEMKD